MLTRDLFAVANLVIYLLHTHALASYKSAQTNENERREIQLTALCVHSSASITYTNHPRLASAGR